MQNIIGIHLKFYHILFYALYTVYSRKNKRKTQRQPQILPFFSERDNKMTAIRSFKGRQSLMNAIYCLSRALRTVLKSPNLMKLLKIFFRLCVCFFLYVSTCSKGHSIRFYLDTIQKILKMTAIRGKLFYARSLKPNSYKTYGHFHQGTGLRSLT